MSAVNFGIEPGIAEIYLQLLSCIPQYLYLGTSDVGIDVLVDRRVVLDTRNLQTFVIVGEDVGVKRHAAIK